MKCDSDKLTEMLNYLNEDGLDGVPFWLSMQQIYCIVIKHIMGS